MQPTLVQHHRVFAVKLDRVRIMGHEDEGAIPALLEELYVAAMVKTHITDDQRFIDQETIELDGHRQRKRRTGQHALRIMHDRFAEKYTEFRKLFNKRHQRLVIHAVDATDEFQVIEACEVTLE